MKLSLTSLFKKKAKVEEPRVSEPARPQRSRDQRQDRPGPRPQDQRHGNRNRRPQRPSHPQGQPEKTQKSQPEAPKKPAVEPAPKQPAVPLDLPPFTAEQLTEKMRIAMNDVGWQELMPVQARTIPYFLAGHDAMIQSKTGSGKTGAFILPLLEKINPAQKSVQVLVLVPTRELALQVAGQAKLLGQSAGLQSVVVYGGVGYEEQNRMLKEGVQLVVGTPGRILDHLQRRTLSLSSLKFLIFDEADRLLSMGFYPDMKEIHRYLPQQPRNGYMFSATFPPFVLNLSAEFLRQPELISLSKDQLHVAETEHCFYLAPAMQKDRALTRIIEFENPDQAIIFCNTRSQVHYVATVLQRFGYNADELSSDLSQAAREKVMARLRDNRLRLLVATDVAARGIDIPRLSHVIQYELPEDADSYIHRTGRTGRAGASGLAISLVNEVEQMELDRLVRRFQIPMVEKALPSQEDVSELVKQRLVVMLENHLRAQDNLVRERMRRFIPMAQSLAEMDKEHTLLAMLLDEFYHKQLHAPLPAPLEQREPREPQTQPRDRERERNQSGGRRRRRSRPGRRRL